MRFLLFSFFLLWGFWGFSQKSNPRTTIGVGNWELVQNKGQWKGDFLYRAALHGAWFYVHADGYTLKLIDSSALFAIQEQLHHRRFESEEVLVVKQHALRIKWLGAQIASAIQHSPYPFYHNYFLGNDPNRWHSKVPVLSSLVQENLYPGMHWRILGNAFEPKHEWIIMPGSDASLPSFEIEGADSISLSEKGDLLIYTSVGLVRESKPIVWTLSSGQKNPVEARYKLEAHAQKVSYELGDYNHADTLIIDPILVFSTYSGSLGDNFGFTATFDSQGHLYAGGIVDGMDGEFPWTIGAFQTVYGGSTGGQAPINLACDISISKYAPDGKTLRYATYLGGGRNEHPHSLVVDAQDNLLVFGTTNSPDFPVDSFSYDTTYNGGYDLILHKFSPDGAQLLAGTFIGGNANDGINNGLLRFNYADDFRGDVYVDSLGSIYVASCTSSPNFPVTSGVSQTTFAGAIDAIVFKMDSLLRNMTWSTFIGASGHDAAYSVKVIDSMVYVSGGTSSPGLNRFANGLYTSYQGGAADGFLLRMHKDTGAVRDFTFFGTASYDQVYFIDFDSKKRIFFSGQTKGNLSRTPNTYGKDNTGQFIGCFNPQLSQIELLTTFGNLTNNNKPDLSPSAFLVDRCDNVYFSGWGADIDANPLSTFGLPVTPDALQQTTDGEDFYLIVLSRNLKKLVHATFFGGNLTSDHVDGGTSRFDKEGIIYQSVCSSCPSNSSQSFLSDFPTTADAVFPQNFSRRCSNAAFKIDFRVTFDVVADFDPDPKEGCKPLVVTMNNNSQGGDAFFWDFGDGNTDTARNPNHTFTQPGVYRIKLLVRDEASCNEWDSAFAEIEVLDIERPDFTFEQVPCDLELQLEIKNPNSQSQYLWDLGDGSESREMKPFHKYKFGGEYRIVLRLEDTIDACRDSSVQTVVFPSNPFTDLQIPNVFTPNGDGLNDCYTILGISEECEEGTVTIFNRWGDKVYEGEIANSCWNGTLFNTGNMLPNGIYFYLVQTQRDGKDRIRTHGSIQLIRN